MSLRIKRRPVEVYLTGKRLEEELGLLENEMHKFLCYYKDNVLPNLEARLHFINNGLCRCFQYLLLLYIYTFKLSDSNKIYCSNVFPVKALSVNLHYLSYIKCSVTAF